MACLPSARVIMVIMCVLMVERLCQPVEERISVLECLLPRAHGCLQSCLIMPVIYCCYLSWAQAYQPFPVLKTPGYDCWRPGYASCLVTRRAHSGPTGGEILLTCAYWEEMEERVVPRSNSFLGSWPLPFIQEREGHIRNGTCDSPTIWHWRELVIHIIMGCNW
jgi:hypothetical protein